MNSQRTCRSCSSEERQSFGGEVALHFHGLDGLNKPIVWVFPEILVCLNCGFAEFIVPDEQKKLLRNPTEQQKESRAAA
ncbi:MAG TPA: hypothetical protein VMP68_28625 [Candidatus Eisenbacteria bacterium]|jgi:hypothetical protein|nr:hypothetical protein [Candidatus Eisenbacteria bacterium]